MFRYNIPTVFLNVYFSKTMNRVLIKIKNLGESHYLTAQSLPQGAEMQKI